MESKKKELREALRLVIKGLIIQEVRRNQLEQFSPAPFVLDEMIRSIEETKRQVIALVQLMRPRERETLIKRLIRQSVDEEIDQAIQVRKTRCFRCAHVRYYDDEGFSHIRLPFRKGWARVIGCEMISSPSGVECRNFIESPTAISIDDYLDEMALLYEVKEMFEEFEEIWDYLMR